MRFSVLRYQVWKFIRNPSQREFAMDQLLKAKNCTGQRSGIQKYLKLLLQNGYVQIVRDLRGDGRGEFVYRLVKDTGAGVPLDRGNGTLYDPNLAGPCEPAQQRIWNALRVAHCALTREDIGIRAEVSFSFTSTYLNGLNRHGYLKVTGTRRSKFYFLVRDTGPFCPAWQAKKLFDQNLGTYMEIEDGSADS
jgi:hypothetical protein